MIELTPDEHKILVDAIQDSATVVHKGRKEWQGLTEQDVKTIVENAPSVEWAVLMTESTLKKKNT